MITAIDTNVLVDVFRDDPVYCRCAVVALRNSLKKGRLVVCDIVWAELAAIFPNSKTLEKNMSTLGVEFVPMEKPASTLAGEFWRKYRSRGGERQRVIADFMIAAHAFIQCDALLTRDRGFYKDYFHKLQIIDPSGKISKVC